MSANWEKIYGTLDRAIRDGNAVEAQRRLMRLRSAQIPRRWIASYGSLALRCHKPVWAIRLLQSVVRNPTRDDASHREKAIYAGALSYLGLASEALKLLATVDSVEEPEALLFETIAHVTTWDYEPTIALMQRYIGHARVSPYQRLVGKVNLAAALVHCRRYDEANRLLVDVSNEAKDDGLVLILSNALHLSAECSLLQRDWTRTDTLLDEASRVLASPNSLDAFYLRKWKAIAAYLRAPSPLSQQRLHEIRDEAREIGQWETVRDCDLFQAVTTEDEPLLNKLYYGTPHAAFRKRIVEEFKLKFEPSPSFSWRVPGAVGDPRIHLSLSTGKINDTRPNESLSGVQHRLLKALCSDFYCPFSLTALFGICYQGEFFNPGSSPFRVHQAKKRLRDWFGLNGVPLVLRERSETYRLESLQPVFIEMTASEKAFSQSAEEIELRRRWSTEAFSADDAASFLRVSTRTLVRLLESGLHEGRVERLGKGRATLYRFAGEAGEARRLPKSAKRGGR